MAWLHASDQPSEGNTGMKNLSRCIVLLLAASAVSAQACSARQPEALPAFFETFINDKDFAISRTIYPSARVRFQYGMENGKQEIIETRRTASRRDDMKYPALGDYIRTTGIESELQQKTPTSAVARLSRPGTSTLVTYHFLLANGCWFLREIQDHAL
jgi:hypothetical protein